MVASSPNDPSTSDESITDAPTSDLARGPRRGLWLLLLSPVVIHFVAAASTRKNWEIGTVEWGVLVIVFGYLVLGILLLRRPEFLKKYLVLVYTSIIMLVISEVTLYFLIGAPRFAQPWPEVSVSSEPADSMPGISGTVTFTTNKLGLRGPDQAWDDADVHILCVGGSTTECRMVTDDKTWPQLLRRRLEERSGKKIFVGNAGKSGHFTLHHAHQLEHFELAGAFDLVIVMCGINDMICYLLDNYERRESRVELEALVTNPDGVYFRRLKTIQLAQTAYQVYSGDTGILQDARGEFYEVWRKERQDAIAANDLPQLPDLEMPLERYREDLGKVVAAAESRSLPIVFATQPTMYRADLPQQLDNLLWLSPISAGELEKVMGRYNDVLLDFCKERDIQCVDLASALPKDETIFYDDCHFNINGCEQVAGVLAELLEERFTTD